MLSYCCGLCLYIAVVLGHEIIFGASLAMWKNIVPRVPDKTKISDSDGRKWKRKTEPFLQRPWKLLENCCVQLDTRTNVVAALPCKLAIFTGKFHHSGSMNLRALFRAFACKWDELLCDERGRNHKRWRTNGVLNPAIALGELEDARPRMTLSFRARIFFLAPFFCRVSVLDCCSGQSPGNEMCETSVTLFGTTRASSIMHRYSMPCQSQQVTSKWNLCVSS